jgi:hypothetical protein
MVSHYFQHVCFRKVFDLLYIHESHFFVFLEILLPNPNQDYGMTKMFMLQIEQFNSHQQLNYKIAMSQNNVTFDTWSNHLHNLAQIKWQMALKKFLFTNFTKYRTLCFDLFHNPFPFPFFVFMA